MCKIILFLLVFLLLPLRAFAENTLNYEMGYEQQASQEQMINANNGQTRNEKLIQGVTIDLEDITPSSLDFIKTLSWNGNLRIERPDYSNNIIRGADPKTGRPDASLDKALSKTSENTESEVWFANTLTWAKGPSNASIGLARNLTRSPYASTNINASTSYGIYNQTSVFAIGASATDRHQPANHFTNVDYSYQERPTTIKERTFNVSYEQVLSESAKAKLTLGNSLENEERPSSYSGSLRSAYAFNDFIYGKVGYKFMKERRNQALKNERGYFTQNTIETELTLEPLYDLLISASYDLIMEDEEDPRLESKKRLGVDQYGLGSSYLWNEKFTTLFRISYLRTNQKQTATNLYGGLQWAL